MALGLPSVADSFTIRMEFDADSFPSHDTFDDYPIIDVSSIFAECPTLVLPDPEPILNPDGPLQDRFIWAVCNGTEDDDDPLGDFSPTGFYEVPDESNEISDIADNYLLPMPLTVLSEKDCSCCQTLRVITHTRGVNVKRLEIHGSLGIITHAIIGIFDSEPGFDQRKECQMFDFQKEAIQNVKWFLVRYMEACEQEGYNMEQDPLSSFYEALSVGLNDNDCMDEFLQLPQDNIGTCENDKDAKPSGQLGGTKIPLATQRARTRKLNLKDLTKYFEFPIEEAAQKMSLCPTVLKKICRRNGVNRWPYRKIRSYKRKIEKTTKLLEASSKEEEKAQALMTDVQGLQQGLVNIYEKFHSRDEGTLNWSFGN